MGVGLALAPDADGARTAAVEGAVRDATGLALPVVTVEARPADGGEARTAVTGADGRFAIAGLPPGAYDVTFTLPGFRTVVREGVAALGAWSLLGRVSWYDEWFDARDLHLYHGDAVVDLEASYPITASTTLTIGGRNAFGNDPEEKPIAREKGNRFSAQTPFGYNGAFYYLRLSYGWASGG